MPTAWERSHQARPHPPERRPEASLDTRPYRRAALSLVMTAALLGGLPSLPARAEPGPEQLVNGTFDNGQVDPWWSTAGTPISVVEGELCAQVPENNGNPWDSIFGQNDVDLVAGEDYRLAFTAHATRNV